MTVKMTVNLTVKLTSSCAVPRSSITIDCVLDTCTPMSRCTPQHSRQIRTPRLTDSHSGSKQYKQVNNWLVIKCITNLVSRCRMLWFGELNRRIGSQIREIVIVIVNKPICNLLKVIRR